MATPDLYILPGLPVDEVGPVFKAPWEAQAFALAVELHEQGTFTWQEWTEQLSKTIAAAQQQGDPDLGDTYYEHWLTALEAIAMAKGLASEETLAEKKEFIHREHQSQHGND